MTEFSSSGSGPAPIGPGTSIGHYAILSSLGRGGMGEVYLAFDNKLDRKVALKVLPEEFARDVGRLKRFELEAKTLAALNHPNIVSVFSIEEARGRHVLVMELVEGRTLRDVIPAEGMTSEQFLGIALSLADAVGAAHARGVTHRDLKPENIMITSSGRVKVLDFGLAKFHSNVTVGEAATRSGITAEGMAIGTAPYMSPEQASGDSIDHRSDVFSLGAVFHEMLTGHQPFKGRSVAQVLAAILRDDPPALTDSRPDAPPALGDIVRRCLRKPPEERYASAVELHEALTSVARRGSTSMSWPATSSRTDAAIGQGEQFEVVGRLFSTKWGLTLVLVLLGVINWIETNAEELWSVRRGSWLGYDVAAAFRWFEGAISFDRHDLAGPAAVYLGSIAYFFVPLVLVTATLVALVPRRDITGYRQFVIAITICYLVSLPFYLLLPIPERWAFPDSQAILLSDLWSARLIETIRPISGLDNCFPSFHVSGTVALVLTWYAQRLRYRHAVAFLGAAVVISTLLLGIHWLADIVAGLGLGLVAVKLARRFSN